MSKPNRPQPPPASIQKATTHSATRQAGKSPVAPPAYRPQPTPKVLQRKSAVPSSGVATKHPPTAPPVYRPHPVPKVLQAKRPAAELKLTGQPDRAPVSPSPTFHKQRTAPAQLKAAAPPPSSTAPARWTPVAAPAHKPQPTPDALRRQGADYKAAPLSNTPSSRKLIRPHSNATIQRMMQPSNDVILIGEVHNKATAKDYVINNLNAWKLQGYDKLGVELGSDEPIGDMFTDDLPKQEQLPGGSKLQEALALAETNPAVRKSIKEQIHLMTSSKEKTLGRMISKAIKAGFKVFALETAQSAKAALKDRESSMDPIAAGLMVQHGRGWVAVVGKDHLAGISGLLRGKGLTVLVEDKS